MRIDRATLKAITGRQRGAAQVRWFKEHLGVDVPFDAMGPILTVTAYEALIAKRLGVGPAAASVDERPQVRLRIAPQPESITA